jgi:hypothetical protein
MKVKMLVTPKGRPEYEKGQTYEFNGPVEETYGRKFIAEGWAEPVDKPARDLAREDQDRKAAEARAQAEQDARDKADAAAKLKVSQQGGGQQQSGQQGGQTSGQ